MQEFKEMEKKLSLVQCCYRECVSELECRMQNLSALGKSAGQSCEESNESKELVVEMNLREEKPGKGKKLAEGIFERFELSSRSLEDFEMRNEEKEKWGFLKEKNLKAIHMLFEEMTGEFELKMKYLEDMKGQVDQRGKEVDLKERKLEDRAKELDILESWIEQKMDEVDSKERKLKDSMKIVDENKKNLEFAKMGLGMKEKDLISREQEVEMKEQNLAAREKDVELKKQEVDLARSSNESFSVKLDQRERSLKEFNLNCFKDYLERKQQLKLEQVMVKEHAKDLETREKELENKRQQLTNASTVHVVPEPWEDIFDDRDVDSMSADIKFILRMDGKNLQIFLNESDKDHCLMAEEVYKVLQLSSDPAKLVLDAMQGFYPPHTRQWDVEYEASVIRRNCILLLEQLNRISPKIHPSVQVEAIELANAWRSKLGVTAKKSMEVLGFLYLLAAYGISSHFDEDELVSFLKVVDQHRWIKLLRVLTLTDRVPGFIQYLIEDGKSLEAINIIYAFDLVDKLPPVPLLKDFVDSRLISRSLHEKGNLYGEAQNEVINSIEESIRAVIKCIKDHKLEDQYSPAILEEHIHQLTMKKEDDKCQTSADCNGVQEPELVHMQITSQIEPILVETPTIPPITSETTAQWITSIDMAIIMANMDGKKLQKFLNQHVEEHDLLRNEISVALQKSPDSPNLVLDAIGGFYPSCLEGKNANHEISNIRKSSIFLLEQLMRLSRYIKAEVKENAQELACRWKMELKDKNGEPLVVWGFLLLVATFNLVPTFDRRELLHLYSTISRHRHPPVLGHVFGVSDMVSDNSALDPNDAVLQYPTGNMLSSSLVSSPSIIPQYGTETLSDNGILKEKGNNLEASDVPSFFSHSLDPAKIVLDALRGCYQSNIEKDEKPLVMKSFVHLLEQLMKVPTVIKLNTKEEAKEFALEWKTKLTGSCMNSWEVLGFLHLVVTYNVSASFHAEELIRLFKVVNLPKKVVNLFQVLGWADKIPGFIKDLIKKRLNLRAISYVFECELADMFPPIPLLKDHMSYIEKLAKSKVNKRSDLLQVKVINNQIDALKGAINCIVRYGLEAVYSPNDLRARIEELERQSVNIKNTMQTPFLAAGLPEREAASATKLQHERQGRSESQTVYLNPRPPEHGINEGTATEPKVHPQEMESRKRPIPGATENKEPKQKKQQTPQSIPVSNPPTSFGQQSRLCPSLPIAEHNSMYPVPVIQSNLMIDANSKRLNTRSH